MRNITYLTLMQLLFLLSANCLALSEKDLNELKDYTNEKDIPKLADAMMLPGGLREISIIVTDYGYFPSEFSVFEGEKVKFYVTGTGNTPGCMILKDFGLFLGGAKGKISEGEAKFGREGRHRFYCPTGKLEGFITVLKRQSEKDRTLAQEKEMKRKQAWYPKDE